MCLIVRQPWIWLWSTQVRKWMLKEQTEYPELHSGSVANLLFELRMV